MDRDESPIGGLANPMQPTSQLFYATVVMDVAAVVLSAFISPAFAAGILLYILASRAYSWRKIRLKQFPVIGFLTVFFFQGAMIFFLTYHGVSLSDEIPLLPALISSLLIGALYPLTQVYQHKQDKEDGVTTISMKLGKRGTFFFTATLFMAATISFLVKFAGEGRLNIFYVYIGVMFPVLAYFFYWLWKVWHDGSNADYRHSLLMSSIATLFISIFFVILMTL